MVNLKAYVESMDYYRNNPDKTLALVAQYTGGSPPILSEALKHSRWDIRVDIQNAIKSPSRDRNSALPRPT